MTRAPRNARAGRVPIARSDGPRDECGVVGVSGQPEAANLAYLGLYALQHRGQESAGIAARDGKQTRIHRAMGLVADVFKADVLSRLPGRYAIGHVRYSTSGESSLRDAQPFLAESERGVLAIAHNGNLTNARAIRSELEGKGSIFQSTMDTELIVHLMAHARGTLEERLTDALSRVRGAYSLVLLADDVLVAARDPLGFRPLSLGRLGAGWIIASETCAFDLLGATFERDIEPGEVVIIRRGRLRSIQPLPKVDERLCVFEHIYFSRPDSTVFGSNVYLVRKQLGRELAQEHPADADLVVPVLDSGLPAALGYAEAAGLPFDTALVRNHYVRRTFIEPEQSIRLFGVRLKHNPNRAVIEGKRIVIVEDSIIRGNTLRLLSLIRSAGAREIHVRVSSPPVTGPCFYGVDIPTREELIASSHSIDEIRETIGADSLGYLSLDALRRVETSLKHGFCDACFSGDYVLPPEEHDPDNRQLGLYKGNARKHEPPT